MPRLWAKYTFIEVVAYGKYVTSFKVVAYGRAVLESEALAGDNVSTAKPLGPPARITKVMDFKCNELAELWKEEAKVIQSCVCVNKTFAEGK